MFQPLISQTGKCCSTLTWRRRHVGAYSIPKPMTSHGSRLTRYRNLASSTSVLGQELSVWVLRAASSEVKTSTDSVVDPVPTSTTGGPSKNPLGYAALFGVALLWGSYTPALRFLYMTDDPPSPALLNALQACLSAMFLISANLTASITHTDAAPHPESANPLLAEAVATAQETRAIDEAAGVSKRRKPGNAVEHAIAEVLNWESGSIIGAGAEIGLWMCLAFGLEVAGVQLTSATKAAFLNQVSVLITPVLVHLSGEHVRGIEWLACALGLLGSSLVAVDSFMSGAGNVAEPGMEAVADGSGNEVLGILYVLASAMFFALSTVRLGRYSSQYDSLKLSTASTSALGMFSLFWVLLASFSRGGNLFGEMHVLNNMMSDTSTLAVLLWVGVGPGALAAFLQATGQQSVPPAQAQVIYSTTPLWAAGCAALVLEASDEAMGSIAWVGAAVMLFSSLMTALVPPTPEPATVGSRDGDDPM